MSTRDDDRFRLRVGRPRWKRGPGPKGFVGQVKNLSAKAGVSAHGRRKGRRGGPGSRLGRGHAAAKLAGAHLDARARRVIVKARIVKAAKTGSLSTRRHLAYIQREAVARDGGGGRLYGADTDEASAAEFDQRSKGDRHQ